MGDSLVDLGGTIVEVLQYIPSFGMLVTFQLVDIISGLSVAAGKGKWNSSVGRKGLSRKVGMLCLLGCAVAIESWVPGAPSFSPIAALYLSWGEVLSILENADDLGIPLPPSIIKWMRERQQITQKQLDRTISGGLNVEFMEVNSRHVDQQAEHVHQHATRAEIEAREVLVKKKDTDHDASVVRD